MSRWCGPAVLLAGLLCVVPLAGQDAAQDNARGATSQPSEALQALYSEAREARSREQLSQLIERCEQSVGRLTIAAEIDYVQRLRAWLLNKRGELDLDQSGSARERTLSDFRTAVQLDPKLWKAHHNLGFCLASQGAFDQALAEFTRAVELNPAYVNAWFNRAETRYELGQFAEALEDYNHVLQLRPDDAGAHTSRAHALFRLRRFRDALADYERAVRLKPDDASYRVNRGDAYASVGRWRQAADDYKQATAQSPQLARAYQGAAWLMATCPNATFRDDQLALQAAEKALQLAQDPQYLYLDTLAAAQANAGDFATAIATAQKALDAAPESQRDPMRKRLELYRRQQPFRQVANADGSP